MHFLVLNRLGGADRLTWIWQIGLLAALYAISGLLGMQFTHYLDGVTLVWPPTGLSLAALILFGRRLWPGVFLGTLLVSAGNPSAEALSATGIAIGNSLEALVGATLLMRVADFRPTLERPRDVAAFLLIGVLGTTTISATIGVFSYFVVGHLAAVDAGLVWLNWWLGDAGGALILTPFLLTLKYGTPSWRVLASRIESWLILGFLLSTSTIAFFGPNLGLLGFVASVSPFPILVWAGTRLGPRGATLASSLIILVATIATESGSGPFSMGTTTEAIVLLWPYAMFIGMTSFTLAAIVEQRDAADKRVRSEAAKRLRSEKQKLLLLERERLTREMHDGLGGQLVSVLSMVERGLAAPSEIAEAIRRAIDDIRIVIDSLDPNTADLPTSLGKLRARLEPQLRRNGIDLSWSLDDDSGLEAFPPEAALHVLRIIQEAVTNSLRHADARRIEVKITSQSKEGRRLRIVIRDDGQGMQAQMSAGGRGIRNMKSRANELDAELRIGVANPGTQIELVIPIPR